MPLTGRARWTGSYECPQGLTGLTLDVDVTVDQLVSGVFSFFPLPANPGVGTGSFSLAGSYDPSAGQCRPPSFGTHRVD